MKTWVKELLPYIIIFFSVMLIKMFLVTPIKVDGLSMYPTLDNGDWMILNRLAYKFSNIKRFDIVVINKNGKEIIKRVIGLPGDNIKVLDNTLCIDDKIIEEDYLDEGTITNDFILNLDKIPEDKYFVMGDNREDSLDSRIIGFIDKDEIQGRASVTIFPFNRWGTKR